MKYATVAVTFSAIILSTLLVVGCGGDDGGTDTGGMPDITAISPTMGPPGANVTISGSGFSPTASENTVTFNGSQAEVNSASSSELQTTVPEDATSGPVEVVVGGQSVMGPNFNIEKEAPGITAIEPDSGVAGTEVTIKGMNFGATAAENIVTFNGGVVAEVSVASETELVTIAPEGAESGPIKLKVNQLETVSSSFKVITKGTIETVVTTTGPDQDTDGYELTLFPASGTAASLTLEPNDTKYAKVEEGVVDLELSGEATNCTRSDEGTRTVSVTAGDTVSTSYDITCKDILRNKIAFQASRGSNMGIYTMNADGSDLFRVTSETGVDGTPDISPDGTRIAFESLDDIYVIDADGTNLTRLTMTDNNYRPNWSHDGSRIAFSSNRDGNFEIYVMNADGTNQLRLTIEPDEDSNPVWMPDGSKIIFESERDGDDEIYSINPDGSGLNQLTDNGDGDFDPAVSPDGSQIVFASNRGGSLEIYTMNADGTGVEQQTNNSGSSERNPAWSPDGSQIAFQSNRTGDSEIFLLELDGGSVTNLTNNPDTDQEPHWSPVE